MLAMYKGCPPIATSMVPASPVGRERRNDWVDSFDPLHDPYLADLRVLHNAEARRQRPYSAGAVGIVFVANKNEKMEIVASAAAAKQN